MPKAPRDDKDSLTPKKRTRKAAPTNGNGVHAGNGNGSSPQSVVVAAPEEVVVGSQVKPAVVRSQVKPGVVATQVKPGLDEQIRERAYELYLRRGGNGGSPEQDWLQARQEICGE
jgi:hypothetical protein